MTAHAAPAAFRYHTALCKRGAACQRKICFFAHDPSELRTPSVRPGLRASSARSKLSSSRRQQQQQQQLTPAEGVSIPEQQEQPCAMQQLPITAIENWSLSSSGSSEGGSPTAAGSLAWMEALSRGEQLVALGPGLEQLTGAPGGLSIRTSASSGGAARAAVPAVPGLVGLSPSSLTAGSELPLAVTPTAPGSPWCLVSKQPLPCERSARGIRSYPHTSPTVAPVACAQSLPPLAHWRTW